MTASRPCGFVERAMHRISGRAGRWVLRCAIAAAFSGAGASAARAQWTVVDLHPAGTTLSSGFGVGSGQQVGYAQVGPTVGHSRASLWSDTAASWVNLHPAGGGYSIAYGADGGQQVGEVYPAGFPRASLWTGTAASWVDLHPAGPSQSSAFGVGGGQQVGRTYAGVYNAALWSGTAASWVNLNPPPTGEYVHSSEAYGVGGGQQVGYVIAVGGVHSASLWTGSAASWVNLHPTAVVSDTSEALGTDGLQQVGIARTNATTIVHASLWSGTAASWVSLNPAGVIGGRASAVHGGQQVGRVRTEPFGDQHASLWSGTAASWVDLHTFLPVELISWQSEAFGITHVDGVPYVVGYAYDGNGHSHALMWIGTAPAFCIGDFDGDNAVTNADIPGLVAALLAGGGCPVPPAPCRGDFNLDGKVDGADIPGFMAKLLSGGACP